MLIITTTQAVALPADVLPQFQMYRWAFVREGEVIFSIMIIDQYPHYILSILIILIIMIHTDVGTPGQRGRRHVPGDEQQRADQPRLRPSHCQDI